MKSTLKKIIKAVTPYGLIWLRRKITSIKTDSSSELLIKNKDISLYKTQYGDLFWLNEYSCVDENIKKSGIFEPDSTKFVRNFVKPGNTVLDIGANIGYYSVIMSKIVGGGGGGGKIIFF
jgi:hypothetical protein